MNSPPPKPEVILTNFFAEPTVLLVPITSRGSAVYKKRMTHNKFLKDKRNKNWEAYRKQRNLVTKLKKQSIRAYFYERCVGMYRL